MAEPLDDLLESCSFASRAIQLLTAEATRRATLLRLCCLEYQEALDRLESLVEQDGEMQSPEHRRGRETGYTVNTRAADGGCTNGGSVSSNDCEEMASDASSIAQSLQQILKQARSIRGDETMRVKAERPTSVRREKTSVKVKRMPQHTIPSVGRSTRGATSSGDTFQSMGQKHTRDNMTVSNPASGRGRKTPHTGNRQKSEGVRTTTLDIPGVVWKEVARYDKARTRLLGLFNSRDGKSTDTGLGLCDGELALLSALKASNCTDNGHLEQGSLPYPIYITWLKLMYPSAREEKHSTRAAAAANGMRRTADEWERVLRLQRSLVMLLDEVEGRREVGWNDSATGIPVNKPNMAGGVEWRGGSRGAIALLPEFEDWYCSNKVTHVSGLLRERVDEMQGHRSLEPGSLSNAAAALIGNPRRALPRENPLSYSDIDHYMPNALSRLGGGPRCFKETASFVVMKELQVLTPPCWPLETETCWQQPSNIARGRKDAEVFAQQLKDRAVLAAETEVSRIVLPSLERALSCSHIQKWPSHLHTTGQVQNERKDQGQAYWEGADWRRNREATSAEEMVWAPKLAVFRAVDAVLCGEGRPRITFVRPEAESVARESRECVQ